MSISTERFCRNVAGPNLLACLSHLLQLEAAIVAEAGAGNVEPHISSFFRDNCVWVWVVVVLWYDMCDFKIYLFLIMRLIRYFSLPLKISFALREKTNFQSNVKFFAIVVESEQCINLDIVIHF